MPQVVIDYNRAVIAIRIEYSGYQSNSKYFAGQSTGVVYEGENDLI
jgi:hypothetical protein